MIVCYMSGCSEIEQFSSPFLFDAASLEPSPKYTNTYGTICESIADILVATTYLESRFRIMFEILC